MAVIDDFKARFPDIPTADVDKYLPLVEPEVPCYYEGDYDNNLCDQKIILYLLAHLLVSEVDKADNAIPTVASQSVRGVSQSFQNSTSGQTNDFFNSTKYGQHYLQLIAHRSQMLFV